MGLGIGQRRLSRHGFRHAASHCEESVPEDSGDGRLLRPGHALFRGELRDSAPRPAPEVSRQYFVRDLRGRAHGLSTDGRLEENEGRSGKLHGEGGRTVTTIKLCHPERRLWFANTSHNRSRKPALSEAEADPLRFRTTAGLARRFHLSPHAIAILSRVLILLLIRVALQPKLNQ